MWGCPRRREIDELRAGLKALEAKHDAFVADIFRIDEEADEIDRARDIQIENIEGALRNHADAIEQLRTVLNDAVNESLVASAKGDARLRSAQDGIADLKARVGGLSGEYESFKKTVLAGLGLSCEGNYCDDAYAYKGRLDQIDQRAKSAEGQAKKAVAVIRGLASAIARMGNLVSIPRDEDDGDPAGGPVPAASGPKPFPPAQGVAEASLASGFETPPLCFAEGN